MSGQRKDKRPSVIDIELTVRFYVKFSRCQPGATPGEGLQLAKLVWPSLAPGYTV
ncbi:Uncharacterised protein [Rikenella microfusus]|uniref:Uncharacterized protein n=1 Tax=Rikenella microfusus TaxID=28139 RepID=A0A379MTG2_9BACT|nr:Uncharacterised protein [Rikenella microfusus]